MELAQSIELNPNKKRGVGLCEFSCQTRLWARIRIRRTWGREHLNLLRSDNSAACGYLSGPLFEDVLLTFNVHIFARGKLTSADGKGLEAEDFTALTNNFLHPLLSQSAIYLNVVLITKSLQHYNYCSMLDTLLSYGRDLVLSSLINAFYYFDMGNNMPCCPTGVSAKNTRFIRR
jgi:hypothetical protein